MSRTADAITIEKLTPHIGAEIHGVDLSMPLDPMVFREIHDALTQHQVIFFRDQHLTHDQHKTFGRAFGELHIHPAAPGRIEGHPEILVIHADEKSKRVAGEEWHSDVSCEPEPPMGSLVYMVELPEVGGDTLFASMYAAYEGLSGTMQRFLEGLTARHESARVFRGRFGARDDGTLYPEAEHPVIRTHPVSGRKALFVNRGFTTRIVQLKGNESAAVLECLYRHIETPEFHCRLRWKPQSLAFWDNRCAQHHALWDYYPARRRGYRVTISGDKPFLARQESAQ